LGEGAGYRDGRLGKCGLVGRSESNRQQQRTKSWAALRREHGTSVRNIQHGGDSRQAFLFTVHRRLSLVPFSLALCSRKGKGQPVMNSDER
ncbi:MAG TPA: hypothetical protein VIU40_12335, partial [Geobacteraceae bacterium]